MVVGLASAGALVGCNTVPLEPVAGAEEQQKILVLDKIRVATVMAVNAQQELALTSDSKMQNDVAARRRLLTDVASYDFYGDVESILKEIATKYGYAFEKYGKRPPEGVNVNVFLSKKPVLDVLRHIGYTSNSVLDIELKRDVIELHYKTK